MNSYPVLILSSLILVSCDGRKITQAPDPQLEIFQAEIAELQSELAHQKRLRAVELKQMRSLIAEARKVVHVPPVETSEPLPEPVTPLPEEVEEKRRAAREEASGEYHEYVKTLTGREFHQATISQVTDVGVEIIHQHGTARLRFADLPVSWRERFFYDPKAAAVLLRQEMMVAVKVEERISRVMAARAAAAEETFQKEIEHEKALALAEASRPVEITKVTNHIVEQVPPPQKTYVNTVVVPEPVCAPQPVSCPKPPVRVIRPVLPACPAPGYLPVRDIRRQFGR